MHRFTITGGGLTAKIMTWGAVLQDLRLAGHDAPLVLGFDAFRRLSRAFALFRRHRRPLRQPHRAAAASPSTASATRPTRNFLGKHTLHGGSKGFGKRVWDVALHGDDFVTLTLHPPDGDMGFPGALDVTCTYRLKSPARCRSS